jgi:hypothetical protein
MGRLVHFIEAGDDAATILRSSRVPGSWGLLSTDMCLLLGSRRPGQTLKLVSRHMFMTSSDEQVQGVDRAKGVVRQMTFDSSNSVTQRDTCSGLGSRKIV